MAEPCLCGCPDCPTCGRLQGYRKCLVHGRYDCEPCEDYRREHGQYPEPEHPEPDDLEKIQE